MSLSSWQEAAKKKREAVLALIPEAWVLPSIPSPEEQRDVSGSYIEQYLNDQEKEITNTDAPEILAKVTKGVWTSVQVTEAFCHRAALAHQLVSASETVRKQKLGR
jgi:amidase